MTFFLQLVVAGVVTGSTYALVALGFSLIFGIMRVLNFAYPEIYMWGAFGAYVAATVGLPIWAVAIAAIVTAVLWSIATDRLVLRRLSTSAFVTPFIATVGVSIFLQNLAVRIFGPQALGLRDLLPQEQLVAGGVGFSLSQAMTVAGALLFMGGLSVLIETTWLGRAIRATSQDAEAARALGVNTDRVALAVSVIAGSGAGLAGFLIASLYSQVFAFMGVLFGLKALVVMVLGGLGNVPGAMLGGVALGILEALTAGYISSGYRDAIAFLVLIVVLLFRPQGLFGERLGWR